MDWEIKVMPVGPLMMNSVLLTGVGAHGPESILIDPGEDPELLLAALEASPGPLIMLLATHGHFDHVGGAAAIQQVHDLPLICHEEDIPIIEKMNTFQAFYGFSPSSLPRCEPVLKDEDKLPFGGGEMIVRHVPGHSPGQVMYILPAPASGSGPGCAIVGDCLFAGGIGRTDLPGGDFGTLEKSIRERIYTLPDETIVIPGHGPNTTVGREKATNPFVRP
jgi:glyoxylase-like metal-dependent hydrolase (beta-lactamase superfamily II)